MKDNKISADAARDLTAKKREEKHRRFTEWLKRKCFNNIRSATRNGNDCIIIPGAMLYWTKSIDDIYEENPHTIHNLTYAFESLGYKTNIHYRNTYNKEGIEKIIISW